MSNTYTIELHRGLKANMPASGGNAEPYFCTDTDELFVWNATSSEWVQVAGGANGVVDIRDFGAVSGKQDILTASASSQTVTGNGLFASSDVGKPILVNGAGAGGVDLASTITGFTDSNTVTIADVASTAVSSLGFWGYMDCLPAFQDAMNAITTTNNSLYIPAGVWGLSGVPSEGNNGPYPVQIYGDSALNTWLIGIPSSGGFIVNWTTGIMKNFSIYAYQGGVISADYISNVQQFGTAGSQFTLLSFGGTADSVSAISTGGGVATLDIHDCGWVSSSNGDIVIVTCAVNCTANTSLQGYVHGAYLFSCISYGDLTLTGGGAAVLCSADSFVPNAGVLIECLNTTSNTTTPFLISGLPVYVNNAAAIAGGLTAGDLYRTGGDPDPVCVVH